jgi:hypothetical protein
MTGKPMVARENERVRTSLTNSYLVSRQMMGRRGAELALDSWGWAIAVVAMIFS